MNLFKKALDKTIPKRYSTSEKLYHLGGDIMLSPVFEPFIKNSPISVMARGMLERVLNPDQLNEWFDTTAKEQYTKDLLFSTLFDLMSQVVQGSQRSIHAAFQASTEDIAVSITSIYNKLNGIESGTSAALVRYAAGQVEPLLSASCWANTTRRCLANASSCLMATASRKAITGSRSCDP
jgi:hypothetical protein